MSTPHSRHPWRHALSLPTLLFLIFTSLLSPLPARGDDISRQPVPRSYRGSASTTEGSTYSLDLGSTFDRVLSGTSTSDGYDALTLSMLRRMADDAQPPDSPRDLDPLKTRQVVERVFAIQSSRSIAELLQSSDLKPWYRDLREGFRAFQDRFRYSVQSGSDGLTLSRHRAGKRLLELNLELNPKQGLDPQIKLGENTRFRYDFLEQRPVLEYGFNF